MVCSGTVVEDPAHPGKSNLVWTAGHCVHSGKKGGWMRNIVFVPSYNDDGLPAAEAETARAEGGHPVRRVVGGLVADLVGVDRPGRSRPAATWAPYDFAVLHVKPENGGGKSLEETVGAAVPVWFDAPSADKVSSIGARLPGRAAVRRREDVQLRTSRAGCPSHRPTPTMYRIGCSMTGGTSGGGWFARTAARRCWCPTPRSVRTSTPGSPGRIWGPEAKGVFNAMSKKFAAAVTRTACRPARRRPAPSGGGGPSCVLCGRRRVPVRCHPGPPR